MGWLSSSEEDDEWGLYGASRGVSYARMRGGEKIGGKELRRCIMGQYVWGPLGQVILQSGSFSSCLPVVFFNRFTKMGALYHYPANWLVDKNGALEVRAVLHEIMVLIQPTVGIIYGHDETLCQLNQVDVDRVREALFDAGAPVVLDMATIEKYGGRIRVSLDANDELEVTR